MEKTKNEVQELLDLATTYNGEVITIESWDLDNLKNTYSIQSLDDTNVCVDEDENVLTLEDTKCGDCKAFLIDKMKDLQVDSTEDEISIMFDYLGQRCRILNMA